MTDQRLAFHGPVRIYSWSETSSQGFKVKVELLEGRDSLSHFETATKRRKKRAGQRYHCSWQNKEGNMLENVPSELMFCGANWSHQGGAIVTFFIADQDDMEKVRLWSTVDVDGEHAVQMFLGLVELDDDDAPINQRKAGLVEWAEGLVGGPNSKRAARLCQDPDFQRFVGYRKRMDGPATFEQCDDWIKRMCAIHTKKLLDYEDPRSGEPFIERYERWVHTPFITWLESRRPRSNA